MATLKEVDHAAVNGSATEPPTQEDAVGAQLYKTPERRHVDTLLDISEQDFLTELEPYEYHCYSGWEEAVSEFTISLLQTVLLPDLCRLCYLYVGCRPTNCTCCVCQNDLIYIFK